MDPDEIKRSKGWRTILKDHLKGGWGEPVVAADLYGGEEMSDLLKKFTEKWDESDKEIDIVKEYWDEAPDMTEQFDLGREKKEEPKSPVKNITVENYVSPEPEFEVVCKDNLGWETHFDVGVTYTARNIDSFNKEKIEVMDIEGKWISMYWHRFEVVADLEY